MKVKYLAAACATLGSVSAFAALQTTCPLSAGNSLDPTATTPTLTYYIAGASAQATPIANIVPEKLFAVGSKVTQVNGTVLSSATTDGVAVPVDILGLAATSVASKAWLGCSATAQTGQSASAPLEVVYNNTNGSAAGLNELLGYVGAESYNIQLPCATAVANGSINSSDGTVSMLNYTCNTFTTLTPDMALADVQPAEFQPGIVPDTTTPTGTTPASGSLSGLKVTTTGLEGFAVIVNPSLYNALQQQNIADGTLPSACLNDNTTLACQPSIRSADYAALANEADSPNNTSQSLLPSLAAANIVLCRRDDFSGSQASSNIYFLDTVCGEQGYGGALTIASGTSQAYQPTGDSNPANGFYVVNNPATGQVQSCVTNADPSSTGLVLGNATSGTTTVTGYALGVISFSSSEPTNSPTKPWRYVKLDGVSPNTLETGAVDASKGMIAVADAHRRYNMIQGAYKFAVDMSASYLKTQAGTKLNISKSILADIDNPAKSDLSGIGYEQGTYAYDSASAYQTYSPADQVANYTHGGNNCQPLAH